MKNVQQAISIRVSVKGVPQIKGLSAVQEPKRGPAEPVYESIG